MSTSPRRRPGLAEQQPYIPALGFDWLTRFYDPVLRLTVREETFKRRLVAQARIGPGHDNLEGRLPAMMEEAGFITVAETDRLMTAFGTLSLYRAVAPQL